MAANFVIPKTNYTIVANNDLIKPQNFKRWVRFLSEASLARIAMTQHSLLINDLLRDFMNTARVSDVDQVLGVSCVIQGRNITITETLLNEVLGLPTANFVPVPTEEDRIAFFNQINCSLDDQGRLPKKIYVTHLPKE